MFCVKNFFNPVFSCRTCQSKQYTLAPFTNILINTPVKDPRTQRTPNETCEPHTPSSQSHKKRRTMDFFVHILLIDLIQYSFSGFNLDGMDDGICTYIIRPL